VKYPDLSLAISSACCGYVPAVGLAYRSSRVRERISAAQRDKCVVHGDGSAAPANGVGRDGLMIFGCAAATARSWTVPTGRIRYQHGVWRDELAAGPISSTPRLLSDGGVPKRVEKPERNNYGSLAMNTYGRFSAAVGSIALNVVLALILAQGAGAAVPATNATELSPHSYAVVLGGDHRSSQKRCTSGLRARTILAVLLGLVV
jgi:hypothetical protein